MHKPASFEMRWTLGFVLIFLWYFHLAMGTFDIKRGEYGYTSFRENTHLDIFRNVVGFVGCNGI